MEQILQSRFNISTDYKSILLKKTIYKNILISLAIATLNFAIVLNFALILFRPNDGLNYDPLIVIGDSRRGLYIALVLAGTCATLNRLLFIWAELTARHQVITDFVGIKEKYGMEVASSRLVLICKLKVKLAYDVLAVLLVKLVQVTTVLATICFTLYSVYTIYNEHSSNWLGMVSVSLLMIPRCVFFATAVPDVLVSLAVWLGSIYYAEMLTEIVSRSLTSKHHELTRVSIAARWLRDIKTVINNHNHVTRYILWNFSNFMVPTGSACFYGTIYSESTNILVDIFLYCISFLLLFLFYFIPSKISHLHTKSLRIHSLISSLQIRSTKLTVEAKFKILALLSSLGSHSKPVAFYSLAEEPFTPILHFIMLIEFFKIYFLFVQFLEDY